VKGAFFLAGVSFVLLARTATAAAATAFVAPSDKFADAAAVHYVADPGETNHVTIERIAAGTIEIRDTGATISVGASCTSIDPNTVRCADPDNVVEAALADGDDFLVDNALGWSALRGGDGNDRIDGGFNSGEALEYLFGDTGDDVLRGRDGADVLDGGLGADLMSGGNSCDSETAGLCFLNKDTVSYAGRVNRVRADADIEAADDGELDEGDTIMADVERIVGGKGNDVLGGITTNFEHLDYSGIRHLVGMTLDGRGGNDVLQGTRAPDLIVGRSGNDTIRGGSGRDHLRGGKGRDRFFARDHRRDRVSGGDGRDAARVDAGLDVVISIATFF
jgi:Ca2+-binding RTX toxin-like protein